MPIDGQADTAPSAEDDLVSFLVDNDDADTPQEDLTNGDEPGDLPDNSDPETEEDDPAEDDDEEGDDKPDDEDPDKDAKPATGLKFKVPVKGEDGTETTIEVDEKELISGYQRHSDYTRKTQELARQRDEVHTAARTQIDEGRTFFLNQAQLARQAVAQLAGLRSDAEMAQLAQRDPATWAAETARAQAVNGVMSGLDQAMRQATEQKQQEHAAEMQRAFSSAWGVLGQNGIDKPKLQGIVESMVNDYGIERERFNNLTDPKLVLVMRDAAAYRALKTKAATATVTKKVAAAPKLPPARQAVSPAERTNKRIEDKFRSGRAGLKDLARFV